MLSCNRASLARESSMEDEGDIHKADSSAAPGSKIVLSEEQDEGEQERNVESDDTIKQIAAMQYPTDPSHDTFNIKGNSSYLSMCCRVGPCQPDMPYPKKCIDSPPRGRNTAQSALIFH